VLAATQLLELPNGLLWLTFHSRMKMSSQDVQLDHARVLVQRPDEVLECRQVVRVVGADGGRLGEPAVRAGHPRD
jgi:hypothetical protein